MGKQAVLEDGQIVSLYWDRSERAISETDTKYGTYLNSIAWGILADREDARECVNDTYLDAWNAMPPHRPSILSTFLGKITRRISIDRWRKNRAKKRGGAQLPLVLHELEDCVSAREDVEEEVLRKETISRLNLFLWSLSETERSVFLCRYWYVDSIADIAKRFGYSESKVKSMLYRMRQSLKTKLEA